MSQAILNFITDNTQCKQTSLHFENQAKVKPIIHNQKWFLIAPNYTCKSTAAVCLCLPYRGALSTAHKQSREWIIVLFLNTEYLSGGWCVGVFWALFDIIREKGESAVKDMISHRCSSCWRKLLMLVTGCVHVIRDRFQSWRVGSKGYYDVCTSNNYR